MKSTFKFRNWEIFLILFLIPFLIHVNLSFVILNLVINAVFLLIWIGAVSFWLYKIVDSFKTDFLRNIEIRIYNFNMILINLIFIIFASIILLLFYKDIPSLEKKFNLLSNIDVFIRIYIYAALIYNLITAARVITAKKLNRTINLIDYYKNAIAFLLLPLGILWVQNEINEISIEEKNKDIKARGYSLIAVTVVLLVATVFNLNNSQISFQSGNERNTDFFLDSTLMEINSQRNDSIFNSMNDSSKADYIYKAALQLYQMGGFREAINNLSGSIELDSLNSEYFFSRGVILFEGFNQLDSAITDLTSAIELSPNDWRAYQNRGFYNYLLGNYEIAFPDIDKVIELKSDYSDAFLIRGELKKQLNDIKGACEDWHVADSLGNGDALLRIMAECN